MSEKETEKQTEVTETVTNNSENIETPKKSNKKKFLFIGIGAIVAALIGVGVFFGIRMLKTSNPVKVTSDAVRGLKESFDNAKKENPGYVELLTGEDPVEVNTKINVELPNNMGKYEAKILAQLDLKGEKAKLDFTAKDKTGTIAAAIAMIEDNNLFFKLPDTMSSFYKVDATEMLGELKEGLSEIDTSSLTQFANYDFTKIIDYLADAIDDSFSKSDFEKSSDEITVNGKDIKVNKYTTNISEKDIMNVAKNFLEQVKKDDDFLKIIADSEDMSVKEVKEQIDEYIEEMKDADVSSQTIAKYSTYVSKTGKVIGYGFDIDSKTGILFASNNDAHQLTIKAGGMTYVIKIEKKGEGHYVASIDLGMLKASIDISDKVETIKKNSEYKETFAIALNANINGQKLEGKIEADTTVKKISSVDKAPDAIDVDNMTSDQAYKLQSELERSALYKTISKFTKAYDY